MREYIEAFKTLSSTRQYGMAPNPIQLTEILAYLTIWETDDRDTFIHYVMKMDDAFLTAKARKAERESKQREAEAKIKGK